MNATKRTQYFHFCINLDQKIIKNNKIDKACLHSKKRQAIKKYYLDSKD